MKAKGSESEEGADAPGSGGVAPGSGDGFSDQTQSISFAHRPEVGTFLFTSGPQLVLKLRN